MFSTLVTIFRGRAERTREQLEVAEAATIIEQKIRDAERGHDRAKQSLAGLILRERHEDKTLSGLASRIGDLEDRARQALAAGMDDLAAEAADAIADLQNEREARENALARTRLSVQRLRLMVEKCERRLVELRQGLITAQSIEAERRAHTDSQRDIAGLAAIVEGEAVLERLLGDPDPIEQAEILEGLQAELSGDDLVTRLSAEGFGDAPRTRGQDVLARLRAESPAPHADDAA